MPTFQYRARDQEGKLKQGIVKADSNEVAFFQLKELGLTLVSLHEVKQESKRMLSFLFKQKIKTSELVVFTTQLHTLLAAGLSLVAALRALEVSAGKGKLAAMLEKLRGDIEKGSSLSEAFAQHKHVFNDLYCSMVKAGEESGRLDEVLYRLSLAVTKDQEMKAKIKQAMSYPIILATTMLGAILALGIFVIPRFSKLFLSLNVELPLPTRIIIGVNTFIVEYWFISVLAVAGLIFLFRVIIKTSIGRFMWDSLKLRVYIFGPLFLKIYMSRFSYLVATLIQSGVNVIDTFDLAKQTATNVIIGTAIEDIKEKIRHGRTIAGAMSEEILFPELVVQMVRIGEEAGSIDSLLEKVSKFYEDEADGTINNLTTLIEPIMLGVIAGMVLIMALAIFLPLWNLHSAFTGGGS